MRSTSRNIHWRAAPTSIRSGRCGGARSVGRGPCRSNDGPSSTMSLEFLEGPMSGRQFDNQRDDLA